MSDSGITPDVLKIAARLSALELDDAECALMADESMQQVQRVRELRDVRLDNALGPALSFDPRLGCPTYGTGDGTLIFLDDAVPPLPECGREIAFAPVRWLSR